MPKRLPSLLCVLCVFRIHSNVLLLFHERVTLVASSTTITSPQGGGTSRPQTSGECPALVIPSTMIRFHGNMTDLLSLTLLSRSQAAICTCEEEVFRRQQHCRRSAVRFCKGHQTRAKCQDSSRARGFTEGDAMSAPPPSIADYIIWRVPLPATCRRSHLLVVGKQDE